jgi:negative regulator of flagellin synthesis FlgM
MSDVQKSGAVPRPQAIIYDFSRARGAASTTGATGAAGDSVSVTDEAKERARLRAVVESAPDVREHRVDELKEQIQSGQYQPDPRAVARSIMNRGL